MLWKFSVLMYVVYYIYLIFVKSSVKYLDYENMLFFILTSSITFMYLNSKDF